MNGQQIARLFVMFAGAGCTAAFLGYAFGLRRWDLLLACGVMGAALLALVGAIGALTSKR